MESRNRKRATPESQRTQAEIDYGTGARTSPPGFEDVSPQTQRAVEIAFEGSMSGWRSREQKMRDSGAKGALPQATINRLTDARVGIPEAAKHLSSHWETMMQDPTNSPDPAWYFGHNRRISRVAEQAGMDPAKVISASASMSPQNAPDAEYRAAAAMVDAAANNRMVTDAKYGRRRMTTFTPDEMQEVTNSSNVGNVTHAKDFDLPGFRSAGTNRREGWRGITEPDYDPVAKMESAKVHWYNEAIQKSVPDTPVHAEYEARFGDQIEARRVRQGRESDKASGTSQIRGVTDRVDVTGLMKGGSDPTDPMYKHPILGETGTSVPDTWMGALLSGQQLEDSPDSASPAKLAASQTATTSASTKDTTFMGPKESAEAGGKKLTGGTVWGIGASRAVQEAARMAREPESQTNIPPVMMQEMTWVHGRRRVADSTEAIVKSGEKQAGIGTARAARLRSGDLVGEKEYRPPMTSGSADIMPEGAFHRGAPDLTGDTVRVIPTQPASGKLVGAPDPRTHEFHQAAPPTAQDMLKRQSAIRAAQDSYRQSRADGGSAWS